MRVEKQPAERTETNACVDCQVDISDRGNQSQRCKQCGSAYRIKVATYRNRKRYELTRTMRYCADCNVDISDMGSKAKRCTPCGKVHTRKRNRELASLNYVSRPLQIRSCAYCGVDITHRHPTAKFCVEHKDGFRNSELAKSRMTNLHYIPKTLPLGTKRKNNQGYVDIKIGTRKGYKRNWKLEHIVAAITTTRKRLSNAVQIWTN